MSILGYLIQRKMRQELTTLQHSNCLAIMQKQMTNSNQLDFYEPTLQQVADLCSQFGFTCAGEADLACLRAILREGFSRYGHQPAPPAEGEVGELMVSLRRASDGASAMGWEQDARTIARAAELLRQRHAEPVPVSERLPGPEDCDAEGMCWLIGPKFPTWDLSYPPKTTSSTMWTHWLPATALPLPAGEGEE